MSETIVLPTLDVEAAPAGAVGISDASESTRVADLGVKAPATRKPRAAIKINGASAMDLLVEAKWNVNGFFSADTFSLTLVLDEKPTAEYGPAFFGKSDRIEIEIMVGDPEPTTGVMYGRVDDVEIDYRRREIYLNGRDYTADLIEARTTEKFPNMRSSEIASMLARRHGLTPVVTATTTLAGTFYRAEHARLTDEVTEWTLLTYLAEQEGFDVYVQGRELHFQPQIEDTDAPRWALQYAPPSPKNPIATAGAPGFTLRRNLTVARDIIVEVISWNSQRGSRVNSVQRADRSRRSRPGSQLPAQRYVIRRPNLTQEQATALAQQKLREFSRHERTVDVVDVPGDERLTLRHMMALSGTGTEFDQSYRLDSIISSIGPGEAGYVMRLRARNLAPASTASI